MGIAVIEKIYKQGIYTASIFCSQYPIMPNNNFQSLAEKGVPNLPVGGVVWPGEDAPL